MARALDIHSRSEAEMCRNPEKGAQANVGPAHCVCLKVMVSFPGFGIGLRDDYLPLTMLVGFALG